MVLTFDNVLADPEAYRRAALAQPFSDVVMGPVTFHGIATAPTRELLEWLERKFADLPPGTMTTFLRRSPAQQTEPNYIHTDRDMGAITGILYLNPEPAPGDGTTFWRHRPTGQTMSTATDAVHLRREWMDWRDTSLWESWQTVEAKFNRLVLFPAPCFHSRALLENYGATNDEARLIQVCFLGTPYGGSACQ